METSPTAPPQPRSAPTLHDVARLSGFSAKTVARALNGEANVREETRSRIADAATALRFRPNRLARELRLGGRTGAVGLVVGGLDNPFYSQVAAGVERALREEDLELVIASTDDDPDRERAVVQVMLERRVRALLIVPSAQDHRYLEGERQSGTPVVFLDRPPVGLAADCVLWDNRSGVVNAVLGLAQAGHRRIAAMADDPAYYTSRERIAAFREAMERAGLPCPDDMVVSGVHDVSVAEAATRALVRRSDPPTAIVAMNNRISVGAVGVLLQERSGCAFVGFDEFDLAAALGTTVVHNDPRELGYHGGRVAIARLEDPTGAPEQVLLPTSVRRRGSGERPPA